MQADPTVVYATDTVALSDLAVGKWPELPLLGHARRGLTWPPST